MRKNRTGRFVAGLIAAGTVLAGCNGGDDMGHDDQPAGNAQANQADITFAREMIPHHEQAIEMAELAPARSRSPEVLKLAEQIEGAQDPEIKTMNGWLREWDASSGGMDHGDMGGDMPGMMTDADMAGLKKGKGVAFDRMFLEMMIEHHEGAIEMAETELKDGRNADAKKLAQEIIDAQQAEIETMNGLLAQG